MTATALIIDDEADIRELIALTLTRMGLDFHAAANLDEARNLVNNYQFDLCLTDMKLPDGNGVEFVRYIQTVQPCVPIAVITAHGNMEAAVDAMKNGAFDFVSKPVDITQLRQLVTQAVALTAKGSSAANDTAHAQPLAEQKIPSQNTSSLRSLSGREHQSEGAAGQHDVDTSERNNQSKTQLIGNSRPIVELRELINKVSRTNAPVWITGESGTGKELIARLVHETGPRSAKHFIAVNCGAIPSELMESELFGHKKGSFTGATSDHDGLFVQASGGTLFLDEVAELPLHMQVKLLRAIQERAVRAVGGKREELVDVRILSASHMDLANEVEAGRFRHDLYYRLNVISMRAPSLRDRQDDIPLLVSHLLQKMQSTSNEPQVQIDKDALNLLSQYHFPGNVRELENLLERAITMMDANTINAKDIHLPKCANPSNAVGVLSASRRVPKHFDDSTQKHSDDVERNRIIDALNETRWNRKAAAENLGLTYRQLRYRIQQLQIDKN